MILKRPLRSSRKVWLAISLPLFIACWFIRFGKHDDMPFGGLWWMFITGDYTCSLSEMLAMLALPTIIFAAGAGLAGWILQLFVCMGMDLFHGNKDPKEAAGNE